MLVYCITPNNEYRWSWFDGISNKDILFSHIFKPFTLKNLELLNKCDIVYCAYTLGETLSPNLLFQLGYAIAKNKPVVFDSASTIPLLEDRFGDILSHPLIFHSEGRGVQQTLSFYKSVKESTRTKRYNFNLFSDTKGKIVDVVSFENGHTFTSGIVQIDKQKNCIDIGRTRFVGHLGIDYGSLTALRHGNGVAIRIKE